MRRPLVVPRSPPPAVTSRRTLMGLIGSGMCLSDVTCPQPPAEHPLSRITRTAGLLSLVRAPALPPRHAYFGSQSHTPYDRCLRFGPRVAATPADLPPSRLLSFGRTRLALASSYRLLLSHPASGSRTRRHAFPRRAAPKLGQAYEPEMLVKVREWISSALASPDFVLEAQPPAQPHSRVVVEHPIRFAV